MGPHKHTAIIGLINENIERDELIIPDKLGGHTIDFIGYTYQQFGVSNTYYRLNSEKIKTIVMNKHIALAANEVFYGFKGSLILNFNPGLPMGSVSPEIVYRE